MTARHYRYTFQLLIFGLAVFLTLNRHSKSGTQNYHSEIWADKAGYYVYLPAWFIYDFDAQRLPEQIDLKTGKGFSIQDNKIITKYPYGVALMQSPFFLVAHYACPLLGHPQDGFSVPYHKAIDIAAVFYGVLSCLLLFRVLVRHISPQAAFITVLSLYLGTNIFYYVIFETGMSHVYSLFLFTALLYLAPSLSAGNDHVKFLLAGVIAGLMLAVRPMNVIAFPAILFYQSFSIRNVLQNSARYILMAVAAFLILVPQLMYWKYAAGSYIHYSYGDEGFTNLLHPQWILLWFSTNNGLFVYSPLIALSFIGLCYYFKIDPRRSVLLAVYFLAISFIFSAWHDWSYGCSYGSRPFVEYFAFLALPFGILMEKWMRLKAAIWVGGLMMILMAAYCQKLMFSYDGCWYGGVWDWTAWWELLAGSTK